MSIRLCRECGHQVSTEAAACPKCGVSEPGRNLQQGEKISPEARAKAATNIGCIVVVIGFAVLALLVILLLVGYAIFGGGEGEQAAPSPMIPAPIDRYAIYRDLVERERNLSGPPIINPIEADDLAARVCASTTNGFLLHLTSSSQTTGRFGGLRTVLLDRRMFVIAYCEARLPDFDAAAAQACAEAVPVVGRNCPGKFSTLPS